MLMVLAVVAAQVPGELARIGEGIYPPTPSDPYSWELHSAASGWAFQALGGIPFYSDWPVRAAGVLNELSTAALDTGQPFFSESRFSLCDLAANERGFKRADGVALPVLGCRLP